MSINMCHIDMLGILPFRDRVNGCSDFLKKEILCNKSADLGDGLIKLVISNTDNYFPLKMAQQGRNTWKHRINWFI